MNGMKLWVLLFVLSLSLTGVPALGLADISGLPGKTIEQRLAELEQEMQILKRQREVEKEIQIKKDTETPILKVSKDGFNVSSKDQAFILKFRGQVQTDGRHFFDDERVNQTNTFLLRRVRPTLEGTVFKYFDFRLMPDFGGGTTVVQDAWVNFKYWKAAQLRVGKFKSPLGLERLQADAAGQFIETALSTNLVPNRDIGVDLSGELFNGVLNYDAGIFNGSADNGNGTADADIHDDKEFVGRIFSHPFKNSSYDALNGFGGGIGGSFGSSHGATLPTYRSGGQNTIFSYTPASGTVVAKGDRLRIAPQAYYYFGPFGVLSEFVITSQEIQKGTATAKIENNGWQVASNYVLTGENAAYTGVIPRNDFDPGKGTMGAFEVVARLSRLRMDPDVFGNFANPTSSVRGATAWDLGINWHLNRNLKFMTHFEQTLFEGGSIGSQSDRTPENALLSRFQVYF